MSLLNKASLIQIPSGYKDGTLYSAKPTNGDGDFTFSRGSNLAATRVNSEGLIEKGRENILTYSNDFSQSIWQKLNNAVVSGQTATDPFGNTNSAWDVVFDGTTSCRIEQSISGVINGGVYASSIWARTKSGTQDVSFGSVFTENFTLTTEWQRISLFEVENDTVAYVRLACNDAVTLEVYAAQLEQGLVATDYIETTTTTAQAGILEDMPRLDYSGGATCGSLLLEPQRSNTITGSEYFDGGSLINTAITAEYNTADTLSPEGLYNAVKLTAASNFPRYYDFPTIGDNVNVTLSSFAKAGTASVFTIRAFNKNNETAVVNFDLSAGTAELSQYDELTPNFDIVDMGNGWYRCSISTNTGSGATAFQIRPISHAQSESGGWSGTNYIYAYGAMFEEGSYSTSYIPTYGSSVTRSADSCSKTGISSLIGQTEGVVFLEVGQVHNNSDTGPTKWFFEVRKDASNSFGISSGGVDSNPPIRFVTVISGSATTEIESAGFSNSKIAIKYTSTDFKLFQNGALKYTALKSIGGYVDIEFMEGASDDLSMPIKQFTAFPTALTDAECIDLTTL